MSDRDSPLFPARSGTERARGEMSCAVGAALLRTLGLLIIPSAVDPARRGAGLAGRVKVERPCWTNDLDADGLVCWACLGSMAAGMIRPPLIPEPECPRRRHLFRRSVRRVQLVRVSPSPQAKVCLMSGAVGLVRRCTASP
jgi:hypothetical protein